MSNNIAAISTASGVGGVAIIRISGDSPLSIAEKAFKPLGKVAVKDFEPYRMYVGNIDCGEFTDFGMCVYFKGPKSYTGEDMVEFHCHGGVAITRGVLRRVIELGAIPASRGEFTKRAFVNGKMSLASAEGLVDMINSESVGEVKAGYYLYREKLTNTVRDMQSRLKYALAYIDAGIDYPEEGVTEDNYDDIVAALNGVCKSTEEMLSRYGTGRKIKQGVKVALFGKPNTGKSSLLNALLDYDKAIVSSKAGTTRDIVEGSIDIDGVRFNFTDTAGVRASDDEIESVGIERAEREALECDICVVVLDGSKPLEKEDERVLSFTRNSTRLVVANKSDCGLAGGIDYDLSISAKNGEGIEELKRALADRSFGGKVDYNADFLTEERHYSALTRARAALKSAIDSFSVNTADLAAIDIKDAWDALGEISGETANESIIDEIFSKFCVGK